MYELNPHNYFEDVALMRYPYSIYVKDAEKRNIKPQITAKLSQHEGDNNYLNDLSE